VENTTPLAVKEALVCGLGVVVSESVAYELDRDKKFISIIPEDKVTNLEYVIDAIKENMQISRLMRNEIREYGTKKFDVERILMNEYVEKIKEILWKI
jgi:glycosyltransferase involved in cell wall biosynthesis